MSTTCARKGCRKKATYVVFLTKAPLQENARFLQRWPLCNEDRDRIEAAIADTLEAPIAKTVGMAAVRFTDMDLATGDTGTSRDSQAELDKEDGALRDRIAHSPDEPESTPVTPEAPVAPAPGGRPVARPAN